MILVIHVTHDDDDETLESFSARTVTEFHPKNYHSERPLISH